MTLNEYAIELNTRENALREEIQTDVTLERAREIQGELDRIFQKRSSARGALSKVPENFLAAVHSIEYKEDEDFFDGNVNIMLFGSVGTGKTTRAYHIAVVEKARNCQCRFELFRWGEFFTSSFGAEYANRLQIVADIDLLIIDDFASQDSMNSAAQYRIDELINTRYAHSRRTIFTTNATPGEMKARVSVPSYDRIFESCKKVAMTGESRRKNKEHRE